MASGPAAAGPATAMYESLDETLHFGSQALFAGRYQLQGQLGRGGLGSVYCAFDEGSGRMVALKVLRNDDPRTQLLFRREYQTLAKLDHPRVIRVYEYGVTNSGGLYYTMELLGGRDLAAAAPLPWLQTCKVMRDVSTSLALLHAQQLVHRDVNPRNVRLDDSGHAKLLDFGALAAFGVPSEVVGTPACISPEALRGEPLDARSDLFSLGVIGYWSLTCRLPYAIRNFDEAESAWQVLPVPASGVPDVPAALAELLQSLLNIDPLGRPPSAADVIDRLGALADFDDEPLWSIAESHVCSATLVGREREQTKLQELLTLAQARHGTLLNLVGERGSGKTRLIRELSVSAQLANFATVYVSARDCVSTDDSLIALVRGLREWLPRTVAASRSLASSSLAHLLPGAGLGPDGVIPAQSVRPDEFEHEAVLRMQLEVARLVIEFAAHKPLLIAIDDADALAAMPANILFVLAQAALDQPLIVVVSRSPGPVSAGFEQLLTLGPVMRLADLEEAACERLVHEIFGDVPHRVRLANWLMLASRGNPGRLRTALLELLERRVVRYGGGAWLLPMDLSDQPLPRVAAVISKEEFLTLSEAARELLLRLAAHHDALQYQACLQTSDNAEQALGELEAKRLIVRSSAGVRLAQPGLARELLVELSDAEQRALHAKLARDSAELHAKLLADVRSSRVDALSVPDVLLAIRTGIHYLRAADERSATVLLRNGAIALTMRGEGLSAAAPAFEEALAIFRQLGRGPHVYGSMVVALTLAGTYSDWRLSYRYADEALAHLCEASGVRWAPQIAPYVGKRVALYACLAVAFVLFMLFPRRRFVATFRLVLLGLLGIGTGAISVCSVMQDRERARRMLKQLEAVGYFPREHPVRELFEYQAALAAHSAGYYAESRRIALNTLTYVRSSKAKKRMTEHVRAQLEIGVLILLGQLHACRTDGTAERTVAEIDAIDTATTRQTYAATMVSYHANRGEREASLRWRERTDQLAAQQGSTWRNDVQIPRMLWSTHALCEDVLTLKRDMEQVRSLAVEVPSLRRMSDVLHACYLCARGMHEEALTAFEPLFRSASHEPGLRAVQELGVYARLLRKSGRAAEAAAICEDVLNRLSPDELQFATLVLPIQLELPLALSALGDHARARPKLVDLVAAQAGHDNPMLHGIVHGALAEVALAERDWPLFEQQFESMQHWFRVTQHPALFGQCQRLRERERSVHVALALQIRGADNDVRAAAMDDDSAFETEAVTRPR